MKELQRKQRIKRLVYSIPMLLLVFSMAVILTKAAMGVMAKRVESAAHVEKLEATAAALALRSEELQRNINHLETEEGIKKELKEKFGVSEEGERMAVIVDDTTEAEVAEERPVRWYSALVKAIKGL